MPEKYEKDMDSLMKVASDFKFNSKKMKRLVLLKQKYQVLYLLNYLRCMMMVAAKLMPSKSSERVTQLERKSCALQKQTNKKTNKKYIYTDLKANALPFLKDHVSSPCARLQLFFYRQLIYQARGISHLSNPVVAGQMSKEGESFNIHFYRTFVR